MISVSILCFGQLVWPDWRALIPVLGTVMVLASARERSIFTGTAPMQWIGTRSYSMYLWHWPLSVGLYYLELRSSLVAVATALLLTALLGHLSYRWVETRLRQPIEGLTRGTASVAMACAALAVVLPSAMIYHERGFSQRLPADVNAMFLAAEDHLPEPSSCRILENGNDKG
jgi:peptidoglycan/LPS O-acetylase OafA/YrhL